MSTPSGFGRNPPLPLEFPQSLAVYDDYAAAQKSVDFLSDNHFPVEQCMIVGTDLKRIERITGRLTTGRVAAGGALSASGWDCSSGWSSRSSPTTTASLPSCRPWRSVLRSA